MVEKQKQQEIAAGNFLNCGIMVFEENLKGFRKVIEKYL